MRNRSRSRGPSTKAEGAGQDEQLLAAPTALRNGTCSAPATPTRARSTAKCSPRPADEITRTFVNVNERPVDDISLEVFYRPHNIFLLAISLVALILFAFFRDQSNLALNIWTGIIVAFVFYLIISALVFPNGPFTRPHPVVWSMAFGVNVVYALLIIFMIFQSHEMTKASIRWMCPELRNFSIDSEKEYGVNCNELTLSRIWSHLDVFAAGHFFGWMFKAMLIRHTGLLWCVSIMWEITEMLFAHLLPNFVECWWDAAILDVLICNGGGIVVGMWIMSYLEMRTYKWESIRNISTTTGKIKRAMLQFTPESFSAMRWLDPINPFMRVIAVAILILLWQITELNTFFIKHIYELPPGHLLVIGRLFLVSLSVAPSIRQFYVYVTDPNCKRLGKQCWLFCATMFLEVILCIKHGQEVFERAQLINVIVWVCTQVALSLLCLGGCCLWARFRVSQNAVQIQNTKDVTTVNSVDEHGNFVGEPAVEQTENAYRRAVKRD